MKLTKKDMEVLEIKGKLLSVGLLRRMLPDIETALFFGKVYELPPQDMGKLLSTVFNTPLTQALFTGDHSIELQDYLLDLENYVAPPVFEAPSQVRFTSAPCKGEILPHMWEQLEVEIATSIQEVADKLHNTLDKMPSREGAMLFEHLNVVNKNRPTLGSYRAGIQHTPVQKNLVILDVSGSMTYDTIKAIVDDVVALSYSANATMAIVSNDTFVWPPGSYNSDDIMSHAQFGGTYYDTLVPLLQEDWDAVVTIADYDSAMSSASVIKRMSAGHIKQVFDISLVDQPTFLAYCVGQLADSVRPLLIANSYYPLSV